MGKLTSIAVAAVVLVTFHAATSSSQSPPSPSQANASNQTLEAMLPISAPVATVIGALIGLIGGFVVAEINRRQKADELFFKALDFLKGGSQERNLGLSAIELYWRRKRHRPLCVSLLAGSAVYLLRESKQGDASHELYNLDRIMDFLTIKPPVSAGRLGYQRVVHALQEKMKGSPGGLDVDVNKLKKWEAALK